VPFPAPGGPKNTTIIKLVILKAEAKLYLKMWEKHLEAAQYASILGGHILKEYFRKLSLKDIEEKAERDFVSFVDKKAEALIREYLQFKFPEIGILGEEEGLTEKSSSLMWVIDPLDGTKNFLAGFPFYAVSIALVDTDKNFSPILGVVYNPQGGDLYYAVKGEKAYKNRKPIEVNNHKTLLKYCFISYGFSSRSQRNPNIYCEMLLSIFKKVASMRRPGAAALDLALVGEGIFDATIEFELKLWDVAAGTVIVESAGGKVSWLNFDSENWKLDIIASIKPIYEDLKEIVLNHLEKSEKK
jgi:myo-inositol-1(or 4)-monophosphatase